jgi:MFS family permease
MFRPGSRLTSFTSDLPSTFWFLWLGTVVNRLGGFVVPFLSLYLTSARGIAVSQAGMVVALYGAGSFASQLVGGELADRLGRRPVLLLSLLGTPPLMLLLGVAEPLWLISLMTALIGFFTDLYRPAVNAAVSDLVAPEHRARAFGLMYWAINLGAAMAPIIAGLMARVDYRLLFAGDALTTLLYGLIVVWRVRETQPKEALHAARVHISLRVRQLGDEPVLLAFCLLALVFGLIYAQGFVTLPLDMQQHGLGPESYGIAAAANGILIVLITIQLSKRISRWPPLAAMALAGLLLGAGFGLNVWATTLAAYILGVVIWTLAEIIGATVSPTVIADLAPVERRGLYQGVFGSAWGLSFFLGPILGSLVFDALSPDILWMGSAALGAVLSLGYFSLSGPARRRLWEARAGSETGRAEAGMQAD